MILRTLCSNAPSDVVPLEDPALETLSIECLGFHGRMVEFCIRLRQP